MYDAAAQLLHAAHGEGRVLDELIGGVAVIGPDGDADAGAEIQPLAASQKRLADKIDDLPRTRRDVLVAEIADLDDGILIAADTGHGVAILDQTLQARGDDAQQLVTLRIAKDFIDAPGSGRGRCTARQMRWPVSATMAIVSLTRC